MDDTSLVIETDEQKELDNEVSIYEKKANEIEIVSDEDFTNAGELTKQVKALQKKAEEYWEPMRTATYDAYQAVLKHKKEMVDPMKKAEKTLKDKMSTFSIEQEKKRKAQEEELRRQAQEEAEKNLAEALEAEKNGDATAAEYAMAEAEVMSDVAANTTIPEAPKVKGVSKTKSWEITSIDSGIVPTSVAGVEIRPVDEAAVMRLIKASKGQVEIPGVTYKETYSISVRA